MTRQSGLAPQHSFTAVICVMISQRPHLLGLPETSVFAREAYADRTCFIRPEIASSARCCVPWPNWFWAISRPSASRRSRFQWTGAGDCMFIGL
jgi:hypothetical protein